MAPWTVAALAIVLWGFSIGWSTEVQGIARVGGFRMEAGAWMTIKPVRRTPPMGFTCTWKPIQPIWRLREPPVNIRITTWKPVRQWVVPLWPLPAMCVSVATIMQVRARRYKIDACTTCGYDTRGLAAGACCPECGAVRSA
ncbi:MAG: hypothetical protein ACOVP8_07880 [Phycisphaerales bacterium]